MLVGFCLSISLYAIHALAVAVLIPSTNLVNVEKRGPVYGVFTGVTAPTWSDGGSWDLRYPFAPFWSIVFDWTISYPSIQSGDTFSLSLTNLFAVYTPGSTYVKRDTTQTVSLAGPDGTVYATCELIPATIVSVAELQCVGTNAIASGIDVSGSFTLEFVFNAGGSINNPDLQAAKSIVGALNHLSFSDGVNNLPYDVTFVKGSPSISENPNHLVYADRPVPWANYDSIYVLGGSCNDDNGVTAGALGTLGISSPSGNLDCSSYQVQVTKDLNDWYFPISSLEQEGISITCTKTAITVNYPFLKDNYRPFIAIDAHTSGEEFEIYFTNTYICPNAPPHNGLVNYPPVTYDATVTFDGSGSPPVK
ncbi:cell-wall agglutinin N-terminal ligand-sugar binding-domain-containing protein [Scheffersomyces amazonensis]|uniref:cell-wall agglutinin N-terminal ligand-sugar binding-domain-containing protein n=1 Tax=Scheffersomyces amazonensis TaxID=1078765 RepID=UPI00315CF78C